MKSSNASADNVVALPRPRRFTRAESEFLPAALEIIDSPASPAGRAVALSIVGFLAAAIVWASFGKVDIIATAEGRVIPTGKSKTIQPFETGVVRRIAVADGTVVKTGDILVELDPTSDASDADKATFDLMEDRLDQSRLRALLAADLSLFRADDAEPRLASMARRQMEEQAAEHQAKLSGIDKQIAQKQAESREIIAAIAKLQGDLPLLAEQKNIRQSLLQNQYGSRLAYLQIEQQLVDTQHDLDGQHQKADETAAALAALQQQKVEASADFKKGLLSDLAKAELSASEHAVNVQKASLKRELRTLRAPVDGTVQQLAVHTLGGIVTPAEQLMVIVPKGTGLEIEAKLLNKDVGFVQIGQAVAIKVEAFTFTRYGLLQGTVTALSQDAVSSRDEGDGDVAAHRTTNDKGDDERQLQQLPYVAHVSFKATSIQTENGFNPIEPGMAVTAEIKTGRRTVLSYLLSPITRLRHETMTER